MEGDTTPSDVVAVPAESRVSMPSLPTVRSPVPPTPFIGRERQVAEVCALLRSANVRLLTLTGPGGIGKTRLALSVVEALRAEFEGGVCYVPLASLSDPRLVLPVVAQALGLHEATAVPDRSDLLERLQDLLAEQQLLLVLDNFEQVTGASAELAALLGSCPLLKVLVTSREVLRLSAEQTYPVPPLTLPDLLLRPSIESLANTEAVRLFVARAKAVQPDFALTETNAGAAATICHRLDGLPLAIELAAARIRLLRPEEMLSRLERRLPWLTSGPRDAPARHQTLHGAIGWSYDLLAPGEQRLFRRMAVFVGGCTLEAAAAVTGVAGGKWDSDPASPSPNAGSPSPAHSQIDLLHGVESLISKSLLRSEAEAESAVTRYSMLETIREYALEQLAASGEIEEVRRYHALYYVALAEEAGAKVAGPDEPAWLDRLEREHDNLRTAMAWAAERENPELGARLASSLWAFWLLRGYISEGRSWLDSLLAKDHTLPATLRARTLNGASRLALRQGDYANAETMLQESLSIRRSLGDTRGEMEALDNLGLVAIYRDDLTGAQGYFDQSLTGWRSLGDEQGMVVALNRMGLALRYQGDSDGAARHYDESLQLARRLHMTYYVSAALHNLGQMEHHRGNDSRAYPLLVESLSLIQQLRDRPSISIVLADIAGVWAARVQPERAARLFGAAQVLRDNMQVTMYSAQRLAYERDIASAAAQLDAATWEAAWAQGRDMSLEDACALAVEEMPPPPSAPAADPYGLTEREREVLRLLVAGLTYTQIAEQLTVSFHTVHAHLRSIYAKLGVTSRSQATRFAIEHLNVRTF